MSPRALGVPSRGGRRTRAAHRPPKRRPSPGPSSVAPRPTPCCECHDSKRASS